MKRSFTLIEVLVVISIVGILAILLMPAFVKATSPSGGIPSSSVQINWEYIGGSPRIFRTPTPDGWLIQSSQDILYIPDKDHGWLAPKVENE